MDVLILLSLLLLAVIAAKQADSDCEPRVLSETCSILYLTRCSCARPCPCRGQSQCGGPATATAAR